MSAGTKPASLQEQVLFTAAPSLRPAKELFYVNTKPVAAACFTVYTAKHQYFPVAIDRGVAARLSLGSRLLDLGVGVKRP